MVKNPPAFENLSLNRRCVSGFCEDVSRFSLIADEDVRAPRLSNRCQLQPRIFVNSLHQFSGVA